MWKRTLLFTALYPGTVCILLPAVILWLSGNGVGVRSRWALTIGAVLVVVGVIGYVQCATRFGTEGRGTPAPYDPPQHLVRGGYYRNVRNPMYLAVVTVLVGEAILFTSLALGIYAAAVAAAFHLRVLLYEEPQLREQFGDQFDEYRRSVPRWFPRLL
jgi:protein-S-isoprenylcysteine O-methyltransferase Ste14